ncbi:MAG: SH3 domain-containing protein [Pseudomonadota bacterium]
MKTAPLFGLFALFLASPLAAAELDVPIYEYGGDGLDTCGLSRVAGLKADGDGFLAVRTGPGSNYRKIDEIHNGDDVYVFEQKGKWYGILYGRPFPDCHSPKKKRIMRYPGKKGWVHGNWIRQIAG